MVATWAMQAAMNLAKLPWPPRVDFSEDLVWTVLGDSLKRSHHPIQTRKVLQNQRSRHHLEMMEHNQEDVLKGSSHRSRKPGLGGHRRASIGSGCESIRTSSCLVVTSGLGQT